MSEQGLAFDLQLERGARFRLQARARLPQNAVVGLFGDSGSGKTSLLRCVAGLEAAQGLVEWQGTVWQDTRHRVFVPAWQRPLGVVFQEPRLFPQLDLAGNLRFACRRDSQREELMERLIAEFGLRQLLSSHVTELSGGQARRVALVRTLAKRPQLLLLDEAFTGLDGDARRSVLRAVLQTARNLGAMLVLVSHDLEELALSCDYLLIMRDGRLCAADNTASVIGNPDHLNAEQLGVVLEVDAVKYDGGTGLSMLDTGRVQLQLPGSVPADATAVRILARDVALAITTPGKLSVLNRLGGVVINIQSLGDQALVSINSHGHKFLALVSRHSISELQLQPGREVFVLVKAAAIRC